MLGHGRNGKLLKLFDEKSRIFVLSSDIDMTKKETLGQFRGKNSKQSVNKCNPAIRQTVARPTFF